MGPVGSGNVVKLLNNMMFFVNLLGSLEALVVGAKAGIDPEVLREVVKAGSGGSSVWEFATRAVLADKLAPRFTVALASKDIGLATALADEVGVDVAMGQMARRLIHQYRDADHGGEDVFGLVRMIEEQAGVIVPRDGDLYPWRALAPDSRTGSTRTRRRPAFRGQRAVVLDRLFWYLISRVRRSHALRPPYRHSDRCDRGHPGDRRPPASVDHRHSGGIVAVRPAWFSSRPILTL